MAEGPNAQGWSSAEAAALRATDELHDRTTISDEQILDFVFLVGNYHLVSMALNACAVVRDDGVDDTTVPFPPSANA